jgi:hypothetical protein
LLDRVTAGVKPRPVAKPAEDAYQRIRDQVRDDSFLTM